jgi:trigger factor
MEISKKELGSLVSEITLKLDVSDYKPQFDQEIKKYRDKAHIKGFRKGKTPISALKKMYGKGLLADLLNKKISEEFDKYIKKEELNILGDPLPTKGLEGTDLNVNDFNPLEFGFKIGLSPEFEVAGLDESEVYDSYEVKINDDLVNDELNNIRKRYGKEIFIDKDIEEKDYISLSVNELDEENIIVENGIKSEFGILLDRMSDEYKAEFVGKKKGDEVVVNIHNLEKEVDREFVTKYFLKVDPKKQFNEMFIATIEGVKDLEPSEINDEFFEKAFPGTEIKTEEAAKEKILEELEGYYKTQGVALTERYILESLVESNDIELPHEFLKEWLLTTNEKANAEDLDKEYEGFVKNLKWSLIKQNIGKKYEIDVQPEELKASMVEKVKKMMQAYNYPGMDYEGMAQNMLQQPEKVREEFEEVYARKVFDEIMQSVTLKKNKIDLEDYKNRVKKLQEQN